MERLVMFKYEEFTKWVDGILDKDFPSNTVAINFNLYEECEDNTWAMQIVGTDRFDEEILLVRYYPNYKTTLDWYQDLDLCKQVDNRDTVYDLELLKRMYNYLNKHGDLFYIKYKNRLCGDVCLQPSGEINIVISKSFQNKHIGRRVINEIIQLAKEKNIEELHAEIYSFNTQSQKMFQSIGFKKVDDEQYILTL